jgi:hypothetical protein
MESLGTEKTRGLIETGLGGIVDLPEVFLCERFDCKMKIGVCLGRRTANRERKRLERSPFLECIDCSQGEENERLTMKDSFSGTPRRGKGFKNEECANYDACLTYAAAKDWKRWHCSYCKHIGSRSEGGGLPKEKPLNLPECKSCGKPATMNSYCASCLAQLSNAARAAKKAVVHKGNDDQSEPRKSFVGQVVKPSKAKNEHDGVWGLMIDFGKHKEVLDQIQTLAEEEIRPLDLQVIYILKTYLTPQGGRS